jgi:class 3 adenylate cyclase/YHS domain-containing protein
MELRQQSGQEDRLQATFAFVDIAGFTALTEAHGDEAAADLVERLTGLIGQCIERHPQVSLLEIAGDAALLLSSRPEHTVEMIQALFTRAAQESNFPILRAGLHHGWVVPRSGRYFGTTINLAARVTAQARGGQVLCTGEVANAAQDMGLTTRSLGQYTLRNLTEPVELFEVVIGGEASETVIDPVCRMRIMRDTAAGTLRHGGKEYWFCSLRCAESFAARPESYAGSGKVNESA